VVAPPAEYARLGGGQAHRQAAFDGASTEGPEDSPACPAGEGEIDLLAWLATLPEASLRPYPNSDALLEALGRQAALLVASGDPTPLGDSLALGLALSCPELWAGCTALNEECQDVTLQQQRVELTPLRLRIGQALAALPPLSAVLYRMLLLPSKAAVIDLLHTYRCGAVVHWPAITSTSRHCACAARQLHGAGGAASEILQGEECLVVFRIFSKAAARDVSAFSVCPDEQEAWLPAGTVLKVSGLYACNDSTLGDSSQQWMLGGTLASARLEAAGHKLTEKEARQSRAVVIRLEEHFEETSTAADAGDNIGMTSMSDQASIMPASAGG